MAASEKIIKSIYKLVQESAGKFNAQVPAIQKRVLDEIQSLLKGLDTKGDKIDASVKNLKLIGNISRKLEALILDQGYKQEVTEYLNAFNEVTKLQNSYFKQVETKFKPTKLLEAIRQESISTTAEGLTESGISSNIINPIKKLLQQNITTGGSYGDLAETLRTNLIDDDAGAGIMSRYLKTYTVTSIAQYSRNYNQTASEGLTFRWYRYVGGNIETTRCFCEAMTEKEFFHKSEIPDIIKGNFQEFKEKACKLGNTTGLPQGMIIGTNTSNFITNAGGWNCQHTILGVPDSFVPKSLRDRFSN